MQAKPQRHKPYGLLKQLPISECLEFHLYGLHRNPSDILWLRFNPGDCRPTLQARHIHSDNHPLHFRRLAMLFVMHVFYKHGIPEHVTSNLSPKFVSCFFHSLRKALDMKLHFTSSYHPEGDRQTEQTNQTLEQYLWIFCNYQQDNWYTLLPLVEFAYNNTPSATTGISLFFANKSYCYDFKLL